MVGTSIALRTPFSRAAPAPPQTMSFELVHTDILARSVDSPTPSSDNHKSVASSTDRKKPTDAEKTGGEGDMRRTELAKRLVQADLTPGWHTFVSTRHELAFQKTCRRHLPLRRRHGLRVAVLLVAFDTLFRAVVVSRSSSYYRAALNGTVTRPPEDITTTNGTLS